MNTTAKTLSIVLKHAIPALIAIKAELGEVPEDDSLLTADEAADLLRVNNQWIYRHAKDGDLKSVRVGERIRIPMSAIKEKLKVS